MRFSREKTRQGFLILSWALYDLANQFFALNVVSLYFVRWIVLEKKSPEIFYSLSYGGSMFLVAVLAPILGSLSDIRGRRKPFLIYFTLLAVTFTIFLGFTESILLGLLFFAIANFGCQSAVVFYNALMVNVSPKNKIGLVSGLGRMFGYTGAILALLLAKPIILARGYQAVFLPTGVLFLIFALPCMIFIKEKKRQGKENLSGVFKRLKTTLVGSYQFGGLRDFLKAAFFGLCAVNAIILFMSIYASRVFGLDESQIINLIAFSTIFALVGSIVSGVISDYFGYRRSLVGVFFLWTACLLAGALLKPCFAWFIGALAGLSLGATWVVFRALVIKLVPPEKIGEVFGLFNLVSYLAAIVGPLFWGLLLLYLGSFGEWGYRVTCLSLILFIAVGFIFILRIPRKHMVT